VGFVVVASARCGHRGCVRRLACLALLLVLVAACGGGSSNATSCAPRVAPPIGKAAPTPVTTPGVPAGASPGADGEPARAAPTWPLFGFAGHPMWDSPAQALAALDMLAADHIPVLRLDVSWRSAEPFAGTYQYLDKLDAIVDGAAARKIQLIISILETPGWANGGADAWTPPTRVDDYARFAGRLAERYRGRILGWEIWNEPDLPDYWRPKPSAPAYAALLLAASAAIRSADPAAKVVAAGATFGNFAFMQGLYDAGARGSFDAMAVHPYTLTRAPDDTSDRAHSLVAILDDAHQVMTASGDGDVPIWITELGWATVSPNAVSAAQQADYMVRSVAIVRDRPWVQVLTMYTIDVRHSPRLGLSRDGVRSPSWIAYVNAIQG
jgi:hypothetical protein